DPKAENGKSGKGKPVDWENHDRPEPNQDSAFPKFQDVLPDDPYARLNNKTPIKESEFDGSPLDSCPAAEEILNNVIGTYLDNHKELNLQSISYEVSETAACHANEKSRVRIPEITEKNKSDYSMIYPEVRSCSKKMQRLVKDVLEDREEGGRMTGLLMGNRIIPAYESHQDGRIFSREIMPEDIPPVTVCLLIDESGSMYGLKIAKALETAILLEDFCRGLNLPLAVVGHSEIGYGFTLLNHYVDFEGRSNQKYRLTNMAAHGCNRDGFALRYCMKLLQRRPEEKKLLIMISDGQPASLHYTGKVAYADLRAAKKECKLSNITLITAAIDEDKEQIKAIYGADCFLNITDLDKMPKQMVKIVLKMVQ
ncbi:cobaltochelatase CobT-related protein, partial [Proteiniphilum sp. UBA7639]|uniref:cobaltochelatase CobT-related protein n=1 Tax=Proteiniphilum sp. UBA7639 TaxID=1947289 RepID=UPI002580F7F9